MISKGYHSSLSSAAVTSFSLLLFAFFSGYPIKYQSGTNGSIQALQMANFHTSSSLCARYLTFLSSNQHCLCFLHLGNERRKALKQPQNKSSKEKSVVAKQIGNFGGQGFQLRLCLLQLSVLQP